MNGLLHVSSSPHARSKVTTDKIMFAVLLALAPAACVGVWNFGLRALLLIAISMAVCPLTEYLYEKGMKKPVTIADGSALVTGLLLAMIIARTYYQGIPRELREAADVDGASEMRYFFNILLPVCMPVVAVLALWQFVAMWNSYFDAMIYLNSASKQPLQLVLRSILIQSQPESGMIADIQSTAERAKMAELLKYATIIISSLPLLVMYPFFQKYFDAGIMAGSVKG